MELQDILLFQNYTLLKGTLQKNIRKLTDVVSEIEEGTAFFCRKTIRERNETLFDDVLEHNPAAVIGPDLRNEHKLLNTHNETAVIETADILRVMENAAAVFFGQPQKKIVLIGVTGTKGKTTVSTLIAGIMNAGGIKTALIGTNGVFLPGTRLKTEYTTPPLFELYHYLAMAENAGCQYAVLEVSSLAVKQGRINGLIFDTGIFTNLYPDHVSSTEHADMDEYRYWKYRFMKNCSRCIVNADHAEGRRLLKELDKRTWTYSVNRTGLRADLRAYGIRKVLSVDMWGSELLVRGAVGEMFFQNMPIQLALPGTYNIENALAALTAVSFYGISGRQAADYLKKAAVAGRCQVAGYYNGAYFIVDYAHNEASMEAVLSMVRGYCTGRVICLFGCGGGRSRIRRYGMGKAGAQLADILIITQDNSREEAFSEICDDIMDGVGHTEKEIRIIPDRMEAVRYAVRMAAPGDFVLLLGKGHEETQEIGGKVQPFSDIQAIKEIIDQENGSDREE